MAVQGGERGGLSVSRKAFCQDSWPSRAWLSPAVLGTRQQWGPAGAKRDFVN